MNGNYHLWMVQGQCRAQGWVGSFAQHGASNLESLNEPFQGFWGHLGMT